MTRKTKTRPLPEILMTQADFDRLDLMVGDGPAKGPAGLLQKELDRATICPPGGLPRDVVGLGRWVHYVDGRLSEPRRVQLVLPQEADIDAGRISVLSHVGAGLIGLREGETLAWPDTSGEERQLTVVLVEDDDPCAD